jgi:Tfp pilus assembly protein PilO
MERVHEMLNKIIFIILFVTNVVSATFCFRLNYRLDKTRQHLESIRVELNAAQNRESDIAESIRRTGEILSSSVSTLAGLRAQIAAIRENYEEMESRLYNTGSNDTIGNNTTNYSNEEMN